MGIRECQYNEGRHRTRNRWRMVSPILLDGMRLRRTVATVVLDTRRRRSGALTLPLRGCPSPQTTGERDLALRAAGSRRHEAAVRGAFLPHVTAGKGAGRASGNRFPGRPRDRQPAWLAV